MKRVAALLPLLSACGSPPGAQAEERIECALDGAAAFARLCTVERAPGQGGFIVRGPGGSFRRFASDPDGPGVIAADGAETATVEQIGPDLVQVSVGADRYRLPATMR